VTALDVATPAGRVRAGKTKLRFVDDHLQTFFAEDAGDGWWHCPSPLRCVILDGPDICPQLGAQWGKCWLVSTDPAIEWNGSSEYENLYGADHALSRPIEPTNLALVFAESEWVAGPDRKWMGGIPMYPVVNGASSLREAEPSSGLASKVTLYQGERRG
jgi:hypothetical protein